MLIRLSSFFLLLFLSLQAGATHIVGGEFILLWKGRGYNYQLGLNMYFDDIHAADGLMDEGITVSVFEKGTNAYITNFVLPRISSDEFVEYKIPDCINPELRTRILRYSKDVYLDPDIFNSSRGYYISWERCCRNEIIDNIERPDNVGNTFYLEFPAVMSGGRVFRNSSPRFKDVQGEYFCLNNYQRYDFGALDANGDSLVYSLVTPYKGYASALGQNAAPIGNPAPYPLIDWKPGYSVSNMIPGDPALSINPRTGELFVKPTREGLYVMSVMVEEFRNGVRIGVNRRDFQFMVKECPNNLPPSVQIKDPDGADLANNDTIVVDFGAEVCYNIEISDSSVYVEDEMVYLTAQGTLPSNVFTISPATVKLTRGSPVSKHNLCFQTCKTLSLEKDSLFELKIIASDDACPTPITDTMQVKVLVKGQEASAPEIGFMPDIENYYGMVGDTVKFLVYGKDKDAEDKITLTMSSDPTRFWKNRSQFESVTGTDSIAGYYTLVLSCEHLLYNSVRPVFTVTDESCFPSRSVSKGVNINVADYETEIVDVVPSNLITPNGDGFNDYYHIPNIPEGNCSSYYVGVKIYNRWGSIVFESNLKDFKWDAKNAPEGLYYLVLDLNDKKIKNWIQVIR